MAGRKSGIFYGQEKGEFVLGIPWRFSFGNPRMVVSKYPFLVLLIITIVPECPASLPPVSLCILLPSVVNLVQSFLRQHEEKLRRLKIVI